VRLRSWDFAACVLVCASGCGTLTNMDRGLDVPGYPPHRRVFGGVLEDIEYLNQTEHWIEVIALADIPFSLVGDVFTLPWTLKAARMRKMSKEPPSLPLLLEMEPPTTQKSK